MKKNRCNLLVIAICILMISFISCDSKESETNMNNMFFDKYVTDDSSDLENILTMEYDLDELSSFFEGSNANENMVFDSTILSFSEVNQRFPVEVIRSKGYSVYKVKQGGYFYVFWVDTFTDYISQTKNEPSVYFSAYLSSALSPEIFDSLTAGVSTADDVKKLDPSLELSFLSSSGIFSYSYLNKDTILQVEYVYQGEVSEYDDLISCDDLVVKEKIIIPRASAPSRYSAILSGDIP